MRWFRRLLSVRLVVRPLHNLATSSHSPCLYPQDRLGHTAPFLSMSGGFEHLEFALPGTRANLLNVFSLPHAKSVPVKTHPICELPGYPASLFQFHQTHASQHLVFTSAKSGQTLTLPFQVTPFASTASELVSSLTFAKKKRKRNISLTYSQVGTPNGPVASATFLPPIGLQGQSITSASNISSLFTAFFTCS